MNKNALSSLIEAIKCRYYLQPQQVIVKLYKGKKKKKQNCAKLNLLIKIMATDHSGCMCYIVHIRIIPWIQNVAYYGSGDASGS